MLNIGVSVKVLPDAEYGGKYTGCVGIVKNYYSSKKKAGVELEKFKMMQVPRACSGFRKISWPWLKAPTFGGACLKVFRGSSTRAVPAFTVPGFPPVKKVIFSGPKTVVLWGDGTKSIVSCGDGDTYDYYAGFCAAVVKKLFGSTTHAKKVLGKVVQVQ